MRLATFNLMHGRSLRDGRVDEARVRAAVAAIDADVLGLQEVDRDQPRSGGLDLAAVAAQACGAAHHRFVPAVVGTPGVAFRAAGDADLVRTATVDADPHYGVALVSRWPVRRWHVTRLAAAPVRSPVVVPGVGPMLLQDEPRVLLAAVVDAPWGTLTVATTHLSFVPGWNVRQLRLALRTLAQLPAPRVLLGDLNLPGMALRLAGGWLRLARRATYPAPAPRVQLDHIMVERAGAGALPRVSRVETPALPVSDHRALVVQLAAVSSGTAPPAG